MSPGLDSQPFQVLIKATVVRLDREAKKEDGQTKAARQRRSTQAWRPGEALTPEVPPQPPQLPTPTHPQAHT